MIPTNYFATHVRGNPLAGRCFFNDSDPESIATAWANICAIRSQLDAHDGPLSSDNPIAVYRSPSIPGEWSTLPLVGQS